MENQKKKKEESNEPAQNLQKLSDFKPKIQNLSENKSNQRYQGLTNEKENKRQDQIKSPQTDLKICKFIM